MITAIDVLKYGAGARLMSTNLRIGLSLSPVCFRSDDVRPSNKDGDEREVHEKKVLYLGLVLNSLLKV